MKFQYFSVLLIFILFACGGATVESTKDAVPQNRLDSLEILLKESIKAMEKMPDKEMNKTVPNIPGSAGQGTEIETVIPQASEKEMDDFMDQLDEANIAFNTPLTLNINDVAEIELLLDLKKSIRALSTMIVEPGTVEGATVQVSKTMQAELKSSGFTIVAITPITQAVSQKETTRWKWEIKPLHKGNNNLHLSLTAIVDVGDGEPTQRSIRTFEKNIEVKVRAVQSVGTFMENNWQWLWTTLLVPLLGYFWNKRKREQQQH